MLDTHNMYRQRHGAAPLTWNQEMADSAKEWALGLSANRCGSDLHHSGKPGLGENLWMGYWGGSSNAKPLFNCKSAVDSWYNEVSQYKFTQRPWSDNSGNFGKIGHFTQLVWKGSKELGCYSSSDSWTSEPFPGYVTQMTCMVVVCRYSAPGNIVTDGYFLQNVLPAQ